MVKIYTKTGDKGETSLFGGKRVSKSDIRVEAYGTVDELNSVIGIVITEISNKDQRSKIKDPARGEARQRRQNHNSKLKSTLINIQKDLFEISSILADTSTIRSTLYALRLAKRVKEFELLIDNLNRELTPLQNFILPGGGEAGSLLHLARTVCRRAERRVVELSKKEEIEPSILVYLNRLSDLLFVMARFVNHQENKKEIIWSKNK